MLDLAGQKADSLLIYLVSQKFEDGARHGLRIRCIARENDNVQEVVASPKRLCQAQREAEALMSSSADEQRQLLLLAARLMLSDQERQVVEAIGEAELKADAIGRAVGAEASDSYFRQALAFMVDRGILTSSKNGYRLADPRVLLLARLSSPSI